MTILSRPPQITDAHLRRRAVVYIRQSSPEQVRHAVGSTAVQRDLQNVLAGWGWASEAIDMIDTDLGVSASHAGLRDAFNLLLERIDQGEIGIVAVIDINRLCRNLPDLVKFREAAIRRDVLLLHGGQITDFRDPNADFVGMILGLNAARENRARADQARAARRKKAEAGIATTAAPIGYVADYGGTWRKDPDSCVRDIIQLVFDKFMELGRCGAVHRYLVQQGLQLPRRGRRGILGWGAPLRGRIHSILRNPAYAGAYVYGATRSRDGQREKIPRSQRLLFENHHEPYIPQERWNEVQQRLRSNQWVIRPPLGRGNALLQGLLYCTHHRRRYTTIYPSRMYRGGTLLRPGVYRCTDRDAVEKRFCSMVNASMLDPVVERELFQVLRLPAGDVLREVQRESEREYATLRRLREAKEREAEQRANEAERAYRQANPADTRVTHRLSERWEEALQQLEDVRADNKMSPLVAPRGLGDEEQTELRGLLTDLPTLWRHPCVTAEQRKALTGAVITMIHVTPSRDAWEIDIEWVGGKHTRVDFMTPHGVLEFARTAAEAGKSAEHIAKMLADRGAVQRKGPSVGMPYTVRAVKALIQKSGWEQSVRHAAYDYIRARYLDRIRLRQIAHELNERGLRHPNGRWHARRVSGVIHRLRAYRTVGEPSLPAFQHLNERVVELREKGLTPREIAAKLQQEGVLTMQRRPVTVDAIRPILRRRARLLRSQRDGTPRRPIDNPKLGGSDERASESAK